MNEEKIRQHFNPIKTDSKAMFQCLFCYKELRGGFCNFKDHLWSGHRVAAIELGVEDPKKKEKPAENFNLNDFLVGVDDSHDFETSSTSFQDAAGTSIGEYLEPDSSFPTLRSCFENIQNTEKKMFRCLMCSKELRGGFRNFQDHMWSSHNKDAINMGVEPPKKKLRLPEGERKLKPVEPSVSSDQDEIRNAHDESDIKTYFKNLKHSKKPKFSCLLCYKELCGNFRNFKDHLWSSHNDFARQFGVYPKKKQPKRESGVTVKQEANDEDEEIFAEPAEEMFDKLQEDADDDENSSENQIPNDKILESYLKNLPDESKLMFRCEICKRHLCGNISNFKIHMWSSHSETMWDLGFKLKGAMRKRKYHLSKQEDENSSEEETEEQPELKKYFEPIKTSKKTMFRCLFCTKELCGNYGNFQQHVWSMHQDKAIKYDMEMPRTKAKLLQNLRPRRNFNMFDSVDNSESSSDDEDCCRLCEEKQGLSSMFKKRKGRVISDMVLEIVPEINIVKGDGFSHEICKNCLDTIVCACELRKKTIETDKKLRGEPEEQYFEDESYDYYNPLEFNVKDEPIETPIVIENLSTFQIVESFHVKEEFVDVSAKPVKVTINEVCKICRVVFHDSETLSRHMRSCFKCDICDNSGVFRIYSNKVKLASHMEACHIERHDMTEVDMSLRLYFEPDRTTTRRLFRCLMCERDFSGTFTNFKFHMWSCHNEASRTFGLVEPRKQRRIEEGTAQVETTVSQLHESGVDGLRIYYEPIRHSTKRLFKCLLCGKVLCGGVTNFRQHIWSTHNQIGREFGMDAPSNKSKASIRPHHRPVVETSDDYKCEYCNRLYKTFYSCHMHKKRDHVEIMFPLECEHCEKRFETKEKLNDHVFITHDNFRCKVCKLQFETRQAYNLHSFIHCDYVEEFIDSDQKYDCALCAFSCDSDEVLQGHLVTHAGDFFERNYMVCIRCSITFKNFEELVNHTNDHNLRITHRCLR